MAVGGPIFNRQMSVGQSAYPAHFSAAAYKRGFQVMLVDPRRIKNVSGRKTDVLDCQWLQQLHTYGLLSGAFRPEAEIRRLRSYLRQRAMLVQYASHHIQHMQKALTQMNVKIQHVISNITGRTGMDIVEAIVDGERDPRKLAQFRRPGMKADEATIAKSLQGHWREEHIFELTQALELYRFYHEKIAECDREIEAQLERFEELSDGESSAPDGKKRGQGNAPHFDIRTHLFRMTGVDLTRIDGIDGFTALKVVSEIGTDMTKWPSAKHFASWLGLSPDNRITGGRVMSSKTKPSASRAAAALRLAATRCTAPTLPWAPSCAGRRRRWVRPKPSPPRRTSWPGSSIPCCGTARSTWMLAPNITKVNISSGRCARPSVGQRNWATSWCLYPMVKTGPQAFP